MLELEFPETDKITAYEQMAYIKDIIRCIYFAMVHLLSLLQQQRETIPLFHEQQHLTQ